MRKSIFNVKDLFFVKKIKFFLHPSQVLQRYFCNPHKKLFTPFHAYCVQRWHATVRRFSCMTEFPLAFDVNLRSFIYEKHFSFLWDFLSNDPRKTNDSQRVSLVTLVLVTWFTQISMERVHFVQQASACIYVFNVRIEVSLCIRKLKLRCILCAFGLHSSGALAGFSVDSDFDSNQYFAFQINIYALPIWGILCGKLKRNTQRFNFHFMSSQSK